MRAHAGVIILTGSLALLLGGCAASERQRPVRGGPVETGAGSLEATRRQLEGTWTLRTAEIANAQGALVPYKAEGRLTSDAFGNFESTGRITDERAPATATHGLALKGRVVIDTNGKRLIIREAEATTGDVNAIPANLSPALVRQYAFAGDVLTLTMVDAAGKVVARNTWTKAGQ